jgi:hypothetical protein
VLGVERERDVMCWSRVEEMERRRGGVVGREMVYGRCVV